jgi:hypothetical protein
MLQSKRNVEETDFYREMEVTAQGTFSKRRGSRPGFLKSSLPMPLVSVKLW